MPLSAGSGPAFLSVVPARRPATRAGRRRLATSVLARHDHLDDLRVRLFARARRLSQRWARQSSQRPPSPAETLAYALDCTRRAVLLADTLRQRGNDFLDYEATGQPPLLAFDYEVLIDGRQLPRPVNYCLVRIVPPEGVEVDETKRPYLIIDPRAGHGAGIGGFKQESQVGVALQAGNPVYFAVFYPEPEPGQTLACVAAAQLRFVREVAARHPRSPKPALVGNCQGGWAVMALAAVDPGIAGPVVLNGAPLSYWAGVRGRDPMRYLGGLAGGSWPSYLLGDLGHGHFDGAWLVQNFEGLNPANTVWTKYYRVFRGGEEEARRFLDFEKWWGGFVQLTADEMRGIVDDLFVGNKLATGGIPLGRGQTLDLRRVRSPVVVFCSQGDNITPPQQALNWIADTYSCTREIKAHGQTIVYIIHADAGHLGIFVSGSVVRREFSQIAGTLANIEALPPGLYELTITDTHIDEHGVQQYDVSLHEREIEDILAHDDSREDERAFHIVAAVSELNGRVYDLFVSPWVRQGASALSAWWMKELHPLRVQRRAWSDLNPWLWWVPVARERMGEGPEVGEANPWLSWETALSDVVEAGFDTVRDVRDAMLETLFHSIYGALDALGAGDRLAKARLFSAGGAEDVAALALAAMTEGGVREAVVRMLLLLMKAGGSVRRETLAYVQSQLREAHVFQELDAEALRALLVMQSTIVAYDPARALETLPALLPTPELRADALRVLRAVLPATALARPQLQAAMEQFRETLGEQPASPA
ncbi:hypothetical protein dqs_1884 [Azoarcus olearius]|uniref:DUF3141 domain-containing protein n=1 Tax=Azoarcus sp. (strain BH72) TaxID=418699 RepID=UPI0008063FCB|nr:DUF3141 domain-containing protein [Azoarcus olearius]ANQ84922.1 hypothetical protein dqs_1884 [Azoarcus olearius]